MQQTASQERSDCMECGRDWEHCHGTLITHADGHVECSDIACTAFEGPHLYTLSCVELRGGCSCE